MTISVWRYSHLALAVSSFLLLVLASVTGIILAFEPVAQKTRPYRSEAFDRLTLAESLPAIRNVYPEITDISIDANQFVTLRGIDEKGENVEAYIDPSTGEILGKPVPQSEFFQWVTALHRSLFLKEIGRFFIGLTSFLLLLIAVSGTALIIQRQRGVKRFFTKIIKENFAQYYHVVLGRLSLIPIILIALTGTYLSMARFGLVSETGINHEVDFDKIRTEGTGDLASFDVLRKISMADVRSVEFPFSEDPEDYYTLKLSDRELVVNQVNGDVLSEIEYPFTALATTLSLDLHTGRTSSVWAIILAIATANILFFIYSGFAITLKRRSNRIKNRYRAQEAEIVILVGSENGSTFSFAKAVADQVHASGRTYFITELNDYKQFEKSGHLLVLAATYGLGDAPTNASRFLSLIEKIKQDHPVSFSVLGFGSHGYPDFCKFAYDINNSLSSETWASPLLEVHTVNDKSPDDFMLWARQWTQKMELNEIELPKSFSSAPKKLKTFTVASRSGYAAAENTFLINFTGAQRLKFTSGDLLAIYPANDYRERLYSIGKVDGEVMLSVKLHTYGLGSGFLNQLKTGETILARIVENRHFHFPKAPSRVVMISNGTGIAPFLGMLHQNVNKIPCYLYSGFKGSASFDVYRSNLDDAIRLKQLEKLQLAYSREGEKEYVKDILSKDKEFIAGTLAGKGVIMICGSLAMQQNVLELLEDICQGAGMEEVSFYQSHGQILMDCY